MSAKLVIEAKIETADDLFEVIEMFTQRVANPFELERFRTYIIGVAQALSTSTANEPEVKENTP
jgi:hypothetical protein